MQETQGEILSKIGHIEEQLLMDSREACHTRSELYSTLVKFRTDAKIVDTKSCGITWIGIGEQADENATRLFDNEALREVIETSGDDDLLRELNCGRVELRRHPRIKSSANNSRPRIIKIKLQTQELRDRLLRYMKSGRQSMTQRFIHSYARTDYTREEINYDRILRRKAGQMNQQEGALLAAKQRFKS
ncbi:hypothetical protein ANCDUO_10472 [Ancylostoma duodenale]|uniref:Uncharacterized protein n=1 Tax=Ancylostoma duodenale TaxID=51022 RepID=A0A0C2GDS5_9BILA|nr:hypothetical protein ANCDUO_10472 [Ancylostoma duodenale]